MDNLRFYNAFSEAPKEAQKIITAGRLKGMTDINPMWRIKKLTEMFGPCGLGWWYIIKDKRLVVDDITKQAAAFLDIDLYYKDPTSGEVSQPIPGTGGSSFVAQERNGPYMSDECFKMALTDAISVASKALGGAANIYYAADRSKYTAEQEPIAPPPGAPEYKAPEKFVCNHCGKVLTPYKDANGKDISIRQHAAGSEKKFGQVLCIDCITQLYPDSVKK